MKLWYLLWIFEIRTAIINMRDQHHIGVGAGSAGPLLFEVKIKFHFCKKQEMNGIAL